MSKVKKNKKNPIQIIKSKIRGKKKIKQIAQEIIDEYADVFQKLANS